jgi:hypothetical protein
MTVLLSSTFEEARALVHVLHAGERLDGARDVGGGAGRCHDLEGSERRTALVPRRVGARLHGDGREDGRLGEKRERHRGGGVDRDDEIRRREPDAANDDRDRAGRLGAY